MTPDERRAYDRAWKLEHPEKVLEYRRRAKAKATPEVKRRSVARIKAWHASHPGYDSYRKWKDSLRKKGLTEDGYSRMLSAQGGVCAICKRPEKPGRKLAVDHCHQTGDVRGLLCKACNQGLGHFRDDTNMMEVAMIYLRAARYARRIRELATSVAEYERTA